MRRSRSRRTAAVPPPAPAPLGVSQHGRVLLAASWLRYAGLTTEIDARRRDAVDIFTEEHLVRVATEAEDPKSAMREIVAAADNDPSRAPVAFLCAIPPDTLLQAAKSASLALFVMSAEEGSLIALSDEARAILAPPTIEHDATTAHAS